MGGRGEGSENSESAKETKEVKPTVKVTVVDLSGEMLHEGEYDREGTLKPLLKDIAFSSKVRSPPTFSMAGVLGLDGPRRYRTEKFMLLKRREQIRIWRLSITGESVDLSEYPGKRIAQLVDDGENVVELSLMRNDLMAPFMNSPLPSTGGYKSKYGDEDYQPRGSREHWLIQDALIKAMGQVSTSPK